MQNHPDLHDDSQPTGRGRGLLIGIALAAVLLAVVLLHLTGVVGGGSS